MNRLGEILEERYPTRAAFTDELGIDYIDPPMISKFATGKANPIPADAHKIAAALNEPLTRIWHPSDFDYGITRAKKKNATEKIATSHRRNVTVRKCFRISKSTDEWFTREKLQEVGYSSFQSWFDACVRRFKGEYAAVCKGKTASDGATSLAARE